MATKWEDLKHKSSPEEREWVHQEAMTTHLPLPRLTCDSYNKILLSADAYAAVKDAFNAPPRDLPKLKELLNKPSFFNEPKDNEDENR